MWTDITRILLQLGAQVNLRDDHGFTPLLFGLNTDDVEVVQHLLRAKADLGLVPCPLHEAAYGGSMEMVELMLALGVSWDVLDEEGKDVFEYIDELVDDSAGVPIGRGSLCLSTASRLRR